MTIWSSIMLILKNWKYVLQFLEFIERNADKITNERELKNSLELLEKGFGKDETVQDAANSASNINDAFRL